METLTPDLTSFNTNAALRPFTPLIPRFLCFWGNAEEPPYFALHTPQAGLACSLPFPFSSSSKGSTEGSGASFTFNTTKEELSPLPVWAEPWSHLGRN